MRPREPAGDRGEGWGPSRKGRGWPASGPSREGTAQSPGGVTLEMIDARSRNNQEIGAARELKAGKIGRMVFCLPRMLRGKKKNGPKRKISEFLNISSCYVRTAREEIRQVSGLFFLCPK